MIRKTKSLTMTTALKPDPRVSFTIEEGIRFFRNGHWWEVEGGINGKMNRYFKCKPVCSVESRFYSELEIKDSLKKEDEKMKNTRGTGRITNSKTNKCDSKVININKKRKNSNEKMSDYGPKKEMLKVLLVGSQAKVKEAIDRLHAHGFANAMDWSPFQGRPNGNEVLTILIQKF